MRLSWLPAVLLVGLFGCKTADTVSGVKDTGESVGNGSGEAIQCVFPAMEVADGSRVKQPYPADYPAGFVGRTGADIGGANSGGAVTWIELGGVTPGSPDGHLRVEGCDGPAVDVVGEICSMAEFTDPDTNKVTRKVVLVETNPAEAGNCHSHPSQFAVHGDCFDCDAWCKQEKGEFLVGTCESMTSDLTRLVPQGKNLTGAMQNKVQSVASASCVCSTSDGAASLPINYGNENRSDDEVIDLPPPPGDSGGPHIVPMDEMQDGATEDRYDSSPPRDEAPSELKTLPAYESGGRRVL